MRVGWLADRPGYVGGGERTQAEFRAAAPKNVEIVDCPSGQVDPKCDVYAIHNSLTYSLKDLKRIKDAPAFRYWNDAGNWYPTELRGWLDEHAKPICCSRLQAEHMGFRYRGRGFEFMGRGPASEHEAALIPPPVDLTPFEKAALSMNGDRQGVVSVAQWRAPNKGAQAVAEWAAQTGTRVDFYGGGPFAPAGSREVAYQGMPSLLAAYQRFVFLPQVIEPFGRLVIEAWAAGCEIVTNRLVGALEWLDENPDAISTAAEDYWKLVLNDAP